MRALVVGAGGFLGRQVVRQFRDAGIDTAGADLVRAEGAAEHELDIRRPGDSYELIRHVRPDLVVNLAYLMVATTVREPQRSLETNVLGVNGLCQACVDLGVPRVIYGSSMAVYGAGDGVTFTEDMHGRPQTIYGWMKQLNEAMAEHYNRSGTKTRLIGVRLSSVQGPRKEGAFDPVNALLSAARETGKVTLPWRRSARLTYIHVNDAADVFVQLALARELKWTIYNSGGQLITLEQLAAAAQSVLPVKVDFDDPGRTDVPIAVDVSWDRLREEFGMRRKTVAEWFSHDLSS